MQKIKSKAKPTPFERYLLEGEHLIWRGRPSTWDLLSRYDIVLIPMSLFWGGVATSFAMPAFRGDIMSVNLLWSVPFFLIGQYFIWGRFVIKYWMRHNTRFAISNQRVFVLVAPWGRHGLTTYSISRLKTVILGSRAVLFEHPPSWFDQRYKRDKWSIWYSDAQAGLYGLSDAEHVFGILQSIIHEKQKR
ncbi:MAG: hypothetical protein AAFR67_10860 [Chloroflexota bacterium]